MAAAHCERENLQLDRVFKALGNPVRLQIVRFIQKHPHCTGNQIQLQLPDSAARAQSTLSQHLKILRSVALIDACDEGSATCYVVNRATLEWLRGQIAHL